MDDAPGTPRWNWRHLLVLLLFPIGLKAAYLLGSVAVRGAGTDLQATYVAMAKKHDAYWYERIAVTGYPAITEPEAIGWSQGPHFRQSAWAFFPLYPLLNRWTMRAAGTDFDHSALFWGLVLSAAVALCAYRAGRAFLGDRPRALFFALVLIGFPFAFHQSMFYTEALFLTAMLLAFLCVHHGRYLWLAPVLAALVLVRPNGIAVLLPLYAYHLERTGVLHGARVRWRDVAGRANIRRSLPFVAGAAAFMGWCLYQHRMTGHYFAFSMAQAGWYREPMFPLLAFFRSGDAATQFNSFYTIAAVLFAFFTRRLLPLSLNLLVLLGILLPLCSGSVASMPRFISVLFPLSITLTLLAYRGRHRYMALAVVLVLHYASFIGWATGHPIGM